MENETKETMVNEAMVSTGEVVNNDTTSIEKKGKLAKLLRKLIPRFRIKITLKRIIIAVSMLIITGAACFAYNYFTNSYFVPLKYAEKCANSDDFNYEKWERTVFNGIGRSEWKKIRKILSNSDIYLDELDNREMQLKKNYDARTEKYGVDYVITYLEVGKTKLTKSELRDYRSYLRYTIEDIDEFVEEAEEYSSSDWGDAAEEFDLTKADTKQLVEEFAKLMESLGRVDVTDGYELEVEQTITGSLLEEPEVNKFTFIVLKVNGRWISYADFRSAFRI